MCTRMAKNMESKKVGHTKKSNQKILSKTFSTFPLLLNLKNFMSTNFRIGTSSLTSALVPPHFNRPHGISCTR